MALASTIVVMAGSDAPTTAIAASTSIRVLDAAEACHAHQTTRGSLEAPKQQMRLRPDRRDVIEDSGVNVSPAAFDVRRVLAPGDSLSCTLTLRNRSAAVVTFSINTAQVEGGMTGNVVRASGDDGASAPRGTARWVMPDRTSVRLAAHTIADVPIRIRVPPTAPTGGAYAAIQVFPRDGGDTHSRSSADAASLGIRSGAAIPVLLRVGTAGSAALRLRDIRAPRARFDRAGWTWRAELANVGSSHVTPRGRVRVRSILGRTVAALPIESRILVPGARTRVETNWRRTPWFGVYRYDARIGAADTDAGHVRAARGSGWLITLPPRWLLAVVGALGVGVALAVAVASVRLRGELSDQAAVDEDWPDDPQR